MSLDKYSEKIEESLIIFYLLEQDLNDEVDELSEEENSRRIKTLALKSLYIDINSFIDELEIFMQNLQSENGNIVSINRFLLLTRRVRKFLNKNKDGIKKLRNLIYAHNYRDLKTTDFIDPNEVIILGHAEMPILFDEMIILGKVCLLVIFQARQCFKINNDIAFSYLIQSSEKIKSLSYMIDQKERMVPKNYIEIIETDIRSIDEHLKNNFDNYEIIAKKLKVKLKHE